MLATCVTVGSYGLRVKFSAREHFVCQHHAQREAPGETVFKSDLFLLASRYSAITQELLVCDWPSTFILYTINVGVPVNLNTHTHRVQIQIS